MIGSSTLGSRTGISRKALSEFSGAGFQSVRVNSSPKVPSKANSLAENCQHRLLHPSSGLAYLFDSFTGLPLLQWMVSELDFSKGDTKRRESQQFPRRIDRTSGARRPGIGSAADATLGGRRSAR